MYPSGIDDAGCDASLWSTHGVCPLSSAGRSAAAPLSTTGATSGSTVGHPGGSADNTTTCAADTTSVSLSSSSVSASAVTPGLLTGNVVSVSIPAVSLYHACPICVVASAEANCDHAIVLCAVGVGVTC